MLAEPVNGAVDLRHHPIDLTADLTKLGDKVCPKPGRDRAGSRRLAEGRVSQQRMRSGAIGLAFDDWHRGANRSDDGAGIEPGRRAEGYRIGIGSVEYREIIGRSWAVDDVQLRATLGSSPLILQFVGNRRHGANRASSSKCQTRLAQGNCAAPAPPFAPEEVAGISIESRQMSAPCRLATC